MVVSITENGRDNAVFITARTPSIVTTPTDQDRTFRFVAKASGAVATISRTITDPI